MKTIRRERIDESSDRIPHIFLSHNHNNKSIVRKLARDLNKFGIDVWLDEWEIKVGESLHKSIGKAIEKSKYIGIAITPEFVKSDWCNDELIQALAREKRERKTVILPLLFKQAKSLPFIDDRLYLDFSYSYFKSLTHLCALLHEANPKIISSYLNFEPIENYRDVHNILLELGWNGYQLVDEMEFKLLSELIEFAGSSIKSVKKSIVKSNTNELQYYTDLGWKLKNKFPNHPLIKQLFEE